jgi:hypothetical protein
MTFGRRFLAPGDFVGIDMFSNTRREKMKKLLYVLLAVGIFFPTTNSNADIWARGVSTANGWFDSEKDSANDRDDMLCWAATASNIIAWSGWTDSFTAKAGDGLEESIFDWFKTQNPYSIGGLPRYAWNFWFTGTHDSTYFRGSTHTGFYSTANYNASVVFYQSFNRNNAIETAKNWLQNDYGVGLNIFNSNFSHFISLWGIDTDVNGNYIGVWVTDSDNNQYGTYPRPDTLDYYSVFSDGKNWNLNIYGTTARIAQVDALKIASVPEPSTVLLLGAGLISLVGYRRKIFN